MEITVGILFILVVCAFLFYMIYTKIQSIQAIDVLIEEFYEDAELTIDSISKLSVTEKLKYSVPVVPFLSFYSTYNSLFMDADERYFRKIETTDPSGSEQIRYLELFFSKNGIEYNEFDIFEF